MTKEELAGKAKLRLRKTSTDDLDQDVGQLVEVALTDLKRIGVQSQYLAEGQINDALIVEAVLLYVKANFGNPENQSNLMASYDMMCTKIKGGGYCRSTNNTDSQEKSD